MIVNVVDHGRRHVKFQLMYFTANNGQARAAADLQIWRSYIAMETRLMRVMAMLATKHKVETHVSRPTAEQMSNCARYSTYLALVKCGSMSTY